MAKAAYHHGDLRKALIEAAEAELAEKGIEGFALRGVAKRAGVSHAAPAHHFADTNALLTALAALAFQRLADSMSGRQSKAADDPRAQFIASGLGYLDFALSNPALFKLMFGSQRPNSTDAELISYGSRAFKILVDAIAAVRERDPLADHAGLLDIAAAWGVVHGLANLLIADRMRFLQPALAANRDEALSEIIGRALPA